MAGSSFFMLRRWRALAAMVLLQIGTVCTAVEVNQATVADLDGIKGIGPALSARILQARAARPFTDWPDLIARVPGLGRASATRLSAQGLTVQGATYGPVEPRSAPPLTTP